MLYIILSGISTWEMKCWGSTALLDVEAWYYREGLVVLGAQNYRASPVVLDTTRTNVSTWNTKYCTPTVVLHEYMR